MLQFTVHGQHVELNERLRSYLDRKVGKLDRYLSTLRDAVVEIRHEPTRAVNQRYVVEITATNRGATLRAEERAPDIWTAIDNAAGAMARQARRHKERLHRLERGEELRAGAVIASAGAAPAGLVAAEEDEEEMLERVLGRVVRVKRFPMKPMSQEEALAQTELLGHNFFLFLDSETRQYSLLYRRDDGDYGLIVPQAG